MSAVAMKTHTKQLIDTLSDMEVSLVLNYINSFIKQRNEMNMERNREQGCGGKIVVWYIAKRSRH